MLLYKCDSCNRCATLRRPHLFLVVALLFSLAIFGTTYAMLLHFAGDWLLQFIVVFIVVVVGVIFTWVIFRLTNKYSAIEGDDVL